jgi:hypothetical protein
MLSVVKLNVVMLNDVAPYNVLSVIWYLDFCQLIIIFCSRRIFERHIYDRQIYDLHIFAIRVFETLAFESGNG